MYPTCVSSKHCEFIFIILTIAKTILEIYDNWDTDCIYDNWEPDGMTIFVTWHFRVTLDSIRNSCDVWSVPVYRAYAIFKLCKFIQILWTFRTFSRAPVEALAEEKPIHLNPVFRSIPLLKGSSSDWFTIYILKQIVSLGIILIIKGNSCLLFF